jgi:hypothetical protein
MAFGTPRRNFLWAGLDFFMAARRWQRFWQFVYNPNVAWRIGYLDVVVPRGPGGPGGPGGAAVLIGLILALAVIAGGVWWVRRRRKRA